MVKRVVEYRCRKCRNRIGMFYVPRKAPICAGHGKMEVVNEKK
jgi:hypothetical protein